MPFCPKLKLNSWQTSACFGSREKDLLEASIVSEESRTNQNPKSILPKESCGIRWSFCKSGFSYILFPIHLFQGNLTCQEAGRSWLSLVIPCADFQDVSTEATGWGRSQSNDFTLNLVGESCLVPVNTWSHIGILCFTCHCPCVTFCSASCLRLWTTVCLCSYHLSSHKVELISWGTLLPAF